MAFDQVKMLQQLRKAQKQLGKEIIEVEALGGRTFISYFFTVGKHGEITVGIVPTLICLMTAVNGVINLAGKVLMDASEILII